MQVLKAMLALFLAFISALNIFSGPNEVPPLSQAVLMTTVTNYT